MSAATDPGSLQTLIAQCARGDGGAFERLYRQTSAKLFGVAIRIVRREDWAEEVLQESFINIWNHAGGYNAALAAPMTWMTSIVRNRALDLLRRPNLEVPEPDESVIESWQDENPGPLELLMQSSEAKRLARCLKTIDGRQRETIVMAFFNGETHVELAGRLKQPLGTVKTWIRRGLERLRKCLTQEQGAGPP